MKLSKKYLIKVPKDVKVIHCKRKNILLILGSINKKLLKLKFKIYLSIEKKIIYITNKFNNNDLSFSQKKNLKSLRKTLTTTIKQSIIETSVIINKKIKIIGVGYKAFVINSDLNNLIKFRLGYSHSIFHKIPKNMNVIILKSTFIYVFGDSIKEVKQLAANIRSYKKPEPYKGKGILYYDEKISLKQGKKI